MSMISGFYGGVLESDYTVGGTATELATGTVVNRLGLVVQNLGADTAYIGSSTVTTSSGYALAANENAFFSGTLALYAISAGTSDVRILELF